MSDATLTNLFRQQAQRLHRTITTNWQAWQAGDESALTPLRHAVHLLKGAALTVSADVVAQALARFTRQQVVGRAGAGYSGHHNKAGSGGRP
mgnify:CR=1 FL=1